jgi:hypothetical protein
MLGAHNENDRLRFTVVPVASLSASQQAEQPFHQEDTLDLSHSEQILSPRGCWCGSGSRHNVRIPGCKHGLILSMCLYQCVIVEISIYRLYEAMSKKTR